MKMSSGILLRIILFIVGIAIVVLGINIGFGGILTLGFQTKPDFASIVDPVAFAIQDSHVRFVGGVWLAVGLTFVFGSFAFAPTKPLLLALIGFIFIGGLCRFSCGDWTLLASPALAPSLVLELLILPLVGYWIHRTPA